MTLEARTVIVIAFTAIFQSLNGPTTPTSTLSALVAILSVRAKLI